MDNQRSIEINTSLNVLFHVHKNSRRRKMGPKNLFINEDILLRDLILVKSHRKSRCQRDERK